MSKTIWELQELRKTMFTIGIFGSSMKQDIMIFSPFYFPLGGIDSRFIKKMADQVLMFESCKNGTPATIVGNPFDEKSQDF